MASKIPFSPNNLDLETNDVKPGCPVLPQASLADY
jgi:hypothetical protein